MKALDFLKLPRNNFVEFGINTSYNDGGEGYERSQEHQHIVFLEKPITGMVSYVAEIITKIYYSNVNQTMTQWKKDTRLHNIEGTIQFMAPKAMVPIIQKHAYATLKIPYGVARYRFFDIMGPDGEVVRTADCVSCATPFKSIGFNYRTIAEYIRKNGYFDVEDFNVPPLSEHWLDDSYTLSYSINTAESTMNVNHTLEPFFGEKFPLNPVLNNQGMIVDNFLTILLDNIIKKRIKLVESSNNFFSNEWIMDFKTVVSDCISSIDVMLNLIYLKAEYDPFPNWKFNKNKLGVRHSRRMDDKIKWVYAISGNNLNIEAEKRSFDYLREIRNHLSHFDPPCFAITIKDAVDVLNKIIDIGKMHIKIRKAIGSEVSELLLNFVLQPEAIHNIDPTFTNTAVRSTKDGYYTSTWASTNTPE